MEGLERDSHSPTIDASTNTGLVEASFFSSLLGLKHLCVSHRPSQKSDVQQCEREPACPTMNADSIVPRKFDLSKEMNQC